MVQNCWGYSFHTHFDGVNEHLTLHVMTESHQTKKAKDANIWRCCTIFRPTSSPSFYQLKHPPKKKHDLHTISTPTSKPPKNNPSQKTSKWAVIISPLSFGDQNCPVIFRDFSIHQDDSWNVTTVGFDRCSNILVLDELDLQPQQTKNHDPTPNQHHMNHLEHLRNFQLDPSTPPPVEKSTWSWITLPISIARAYPLNLRGAGNGSRIRISGPVKGRETKNGMFFFSHQHVTQHNKDP